MSPFVRRYAKYLSEKSVSYMKVAFDFCKVKRGKDGGTIRKMSSEKLLKTLPILHEQESAPQLNFFGHNSSGIRGRELHKNLVQMLLKYPEVRKNWPMKFD